MKSIMQDKKQCWICGSPNVEVHHVFYGRGLRELSDKYGCTVYLCPTHHRGRPLGVHFDHDMDRFLKRLTQLKFEQEHGRNEFIRIFGRNYVE